MPILLLFVLAGAPIVLSGLGVLPGRLPPVASAAVLLALAAALVLVRRRPTAALVLAAVVWQIVFVGLATDGSLEAAGTAGIGLAVVAHLAGRHATDGSRGAAVLGALAASAGVGTYLVTGGADDALAAVGGVLVLAVVPWSVGRYRLRYAAMVREGWDRAERAERAAERAGEHARAQERARLAADMHDLVGHELAHVALRIGALEIDRSLSDAHRATAGEARSGITAAAERLADAVRVLRTDDVAPDPAVLVARTRAAGMAVDLVEAGDPGDPVVERTAARIVAEALTNAMKHAPGAAVSVRVTRAADGTAVQVRSAAPVRRPVVVPGGGHGLVGLAERVRLLGGRFAAGPDGTGFLVDVALPPAPAAPAPPTARSEHDRARADVRRSARSAALVAAAVAVGLTVATVGYTVVDAATSVLPPPRLAALHLGDAAADVEAALPWRTRVDALDDGPPEPAGARCRYYSVDADPLRRDLHRICLRDGVLVTADLVVRGGGAR